MPHPMKNRLGDILVRGGLITSDQLNFAIHEQNRQQQTATITQVIPLTPQTPPAITFSCTREIQRAYRENQYQFTLQIPSDTPTAKTPTCKSVSPINKVNRHSL